jgi:hypothetical protein
MATNTAVRRPVPDNYSALFPGRFLKADMFKGKKVTLTIKAIFGEDMTDAEDQTKAEWIVQFAEKPFEWVMNKTGAYCLFRMWGGDPRSWVGHKVTLFPKAGTWFGEKGEAIRVWGSPELAEDIPITLKFMRKKAERNMVMHRVEATKTAPTPQPQPNATSVTRTLPPRALEILPLLGWGADVVQRWIDVNAALSDNDLVVKLEALLDT